MRKFGQDSIQEGAFGPESGSGVGVPQVETSINKVSSVTERHCLICSLCPQNLEQGLGHSSCSVHFFMYASVKCEGQRDDLSAEWLKVAPGYLCWGRRMTTRNHQELKL